jgi:hypothetical protein
MDNIRVSDDKPTVKESEELLNKMQSLLEAHETAITQSATAESEKVLDQIKKLLDENEAARTSPVTQEMEETLDKLKSVLDAKAHPTILPDSAVKFTYSEPVKQDTPQITTPPKNIEPSREVVRVTESTAIEETASLPKEKFAIVPVQPSHESVKTSETTKSSTKINNDPPKSESTINSGVKLVQAPPLEPPQGQATTKTTTNEAEKPVKQTSSPKIEEGIPLVPPPTTAPLQPPPPSENKIANGNKLASLIVDPAKLRSGSYYVQIATMSNEKNINGLVADYSDKYPIALVPSPLSGAYQVLIGPLNIDEYGIVLARFQKNGFKDAFVKKIR